MPGAYLHNMGREHLRAEEAATIRAPIMTDAHDTCIDLLVIGDSLAFPRPGDPGSAQTPQQTWPYLLAQQMSWDTVWFRSRGASTSREVAGETQSLRPYLASQSVRISVVQCGIVDAAPRPYSLRMRSVVESPTVMRAVRRFEPDWNPRRSKRLLSWWGRPWIDVEEFEENIVNSLEALGNYSRTILLVGIQAPGQRLRQLLGDFTVEPYNDALERAASAHSQASFLDCALPLTLDGHHLSGRGHAELAQVLAEVATDSRA